MIVKVCGITNARDAEAAIDHGANAIGFNFYARSPRYITPERAGEIPAEVLRVGVFVNESPEEVELIAAIARLDVAQLHGDETAAQIPAGIRSWKAARVGDGFSFAPYDELAVEALLLDGPAGTLYGGAGATFDWSLARGHNRRIVIAGGLDASNVRRAIELAQPWGVDACSKIESAPGIKDHRKMTAFLQAALAENS